MNLLFDLDGTLFPVDPLEDACFGEACRVVLGVEPHGDWSRYPVVTDLGILRSVARDILQRPPTSDEEVRFDRVYAALLWDAVRRSPTAYRTPVPGAREMLAAFRGSYGMGIATGNLRKAARIKLQACGLEVDDLPLVGAEDGVDRAALVRRCAELVGGDVVSVGDGVWDVAAAWEVGVPFVGIAASDLVEARLRRAGATTILRDYTDLGVVREAVRGARCPGS